MKNKQLANIKRAAAFLKLAFAACPSGSRPSLAIGYDGQIAVSVFEVGNNDAATQLMRDLGIGEREKTIHEAGTRPWHTLCGKNDGVTVTAFVDGVPHTCKIEHYVEQVPKTQVVTTGEFVEIPRTRVVCG